MKSSFTLRFHDYFISGDLELFTMSGIPPLMKALWDPFICFSRGLSTVSLIFTRTMNVDIGRLYQLAKLFG